MRNKKELGVKLRELRKKRGLTQQELADQVGIAQEKVSNFESGKGGKLDSLFAVLAVLEVELSVEGRAEKDSRWSDLMSDS